jgi:starch synthase (maltosyl-transferring)
VWQGSHNYIELTPEKIPAHIFRVLRRVRSEKDFDYYQ